MNTGFAYQNLKTNLLVLPSFGQLLGLRHATFLSKSNLFPSTRYVKFHEISYWKGVTISWKDYGGINVVLLLQTTNR
jgi:hypothetical protein